MGKKALLPAGRHGMKVAVVNTVDGDGVKGGNQLLTERLYQELKVRTGHDVDMHWLPSVGSVRGLVQSYVTAMALDVSGYDAVVSMKFPSFTVQHPRHLCLLNHRCKTFYSDWDRTLERHSASVPLLRVLRRALHWYDTRCLRNVNVLAQSETIRDRIAAADIQAEVLHPPSPLSGLHAESYDYVLVPSRLDDRGKRVSLALDAMEHVQDVSMVVTGTGPDAEMLQERAAEDVRFTGHVSDDRMVDLYADALVVLYPARDEDYGLGVVEAFKAETPVVACTDAGGPLEFVEDGRNGYVTEPESTAVAEALQSLVDDIGKARRFGQEGKSRVSDISWERYVQAVNERLEAMEEPR